MQKQSPNLFTQVSTDHPGNLTSEVKETLASCYCDIKTKLFTATDLWNIQRQGKGRIQRRFSF